MSGHGKRVADGQVGLDAQSQSIISAAMWVQERWCSGLSLTWAHISSIRSGAGSSLYEYCTSHRDRGSVATTVTHTVPLGDGRRECKGKLASPLSHRMASAHAGPTEWHGRHGLPFSPLSTSVISSFVSYLSSRPSSAVRCTRGGRLPRLALGDVGRPAFHRAWEPAVVLEYSNTPRYVAGWYCISQACAAPGPAH